MSAVHPPAYEPPLVLDVGGQKFFYPKSSLDLLKETLVARSVFKGDAQEDYVDANPHLWSKWIDPYIRDRILPVKTSLTDPQEKEALFSLVKRLNIAAIEAHLCSPPPPLPTMGREFWESHGWNVGEVPPFKVDLEKELVKPCPFEKGKTKAETHVLVLMPAKVNGKKYSLKTLQKLVGRFVYYRSEVKAREKQSPEKSNWFLMYRGMVPESLGKARDEQLQLAKSYSGYRAPTILEAVTVVMMYSKLTGENFFLDGYTCCEEKTNGIKTIVGGVLNSGLPIYGTCDLNSNVGVVALQEV